MSDDKAKSFQKEEAFKKVPVSEKKALCRQIINERAVVLAMGVGDNLYRLMPESLEEDDQYLVCTLSANSEPEDFLQEVIINITIGENRYFMMSYMSHDGRIAKVDMHREMYVLQRRRNIRLMLPDEYPATLALLFYNDREVLIDGRIIDFSSGGCRVQIKTAKIEIYVGDRFKGTLSLGSRRSFSIQGQVRHTTTDVVDNKIMQTFGIQFGPMDKAMETKLITIFMDLQREVFMANPIK